MSTSSTTIMKRITHDQLFRRIFSDQEAQRDLLALALPEDLLATFRMETLRDVSDRVQGEEPKRPETAASEADGSNTPRRFPRPGQVDLLLSVEDTSARDHLVYVLVEHKSYPDNRVALQLLHYMAGLWRQWNTLPLPVIHPVILYHGPRRWSVPTELVELHTLDPRHRGSSPIPDPPPTGGYPVNLRYHLLDLNTIPPEQLEGRTHAQAYAGLIAFKYVMRRLRKPELRRLLRASVSREIPSEVRRAVWLYIFEYLPEEERERIVTEAEKMEYTVEGERMYSIADSLRDEGIEIGRREGLERGVEQGRVQESRRILLRLLEKRFRLTGDDRSAVSDCEDLDSLEAAADLLLEPEATKAAVLELLRDT